MTILVAGGGIAGLAAALALERAGAAVELSERNAAFTEAGAGLQIGPNGVKALEWLGAWPHVEPFTFQPPAIRIMDGITGRCLQEIALGARFARRFGAPYRVVHRADLLKGLITTAAARPGITLMANRGIEAVDGAPERPVATLTGGGRRSYRAIIGADGIRGAVRESLIGDGPPRLAGQIIYRALVPVSQIAGAGPAVTLWLCPGGHVVHYPVSGGRMMNIVVARDGTWTDFGWSAPADAEEVQAAFPQADVALRYVLNIPQDWLKWAGADRAPTRGWSKGAVTLIGDAAHPMLPYLAQGAVMALEDAVTLGTALTGMATPADAFRAYEQARYSRTARVQREARRMARIYHADGWLRQARNLSLASLPPALALSRLGWLYRWQPPVIRS